MGLRVKSTNYLYISILSIKRHSKICTRTSFDFITYDTGTGDFRIGTLYVNIYEQSGDYIYIGIRRSKYNLYIVFRHFVIILIIIIIIYYVCA